MLCAEEKKISFWNGNENFDCLVPSLHLYTDLCYNLHINVIASEVNKGNYSDNNENFHLIR